MINFLLQNEVNMKFVKLPEVCENSPESGSNYCAEHREVAEEMGISTARIKGKPAVAVFALDETAFDGDLTDDAPVRTVTRDQGVSCRNKKVVAPWCTKDLGHMEQGGCWSRGLFVFFHACGVISSFSPLYT